MKNVLLLSSGRRVELVQCFQRAFSSMSPSSKVVAADAQALAPALYFAEHSVVLPKINEDSYKEELVKVIKKFQIDLVVPTIDPELPVLARLKSEIEAETNAYVMVAEPWVIDICNDKVLTHDHIVKNGLLSPKLYDLEIKIESNEFPLMLKPRAGSSSIGVNTVRTQEDLDFLVPQTADPMLQELVVGEEYTVDCFSDFDGKVISTVPRLRIATRGGEILKGRITKDPTIISAVQDLLATLPMPGHSTVQCFKTNRGVEFIEINPRFGGGAPMSIAAGADSCKRLVSLINGDSLEYDESYQDGLTFLRFDQSIVLTDDEISRFQID